MELDQAGSIYGVLHALSQNHRAIPNGYAGGLVLPSGRRERVCTTKKNRVKDE
jgi:hypothetical protein